MSAVQVLLDRIQVNCKFLWGSHCSYKVEAITGDNREHWQVLVKDDFGTHLGLQRFMTSVHRDTDSAWKEVDVTLEFYAWAKKEGILELTEDQIRLAKLKFAQILGYR